MKAAMINDRLDKSATTETVRSQVALRLRSTLPVVGLIGAGLITLAWWLVVARSLWFAYEWASV